MVQMNRPRDYNGKIKVVPMVVALIGTSRIPLFGNSSWTNKYATDLFCWGESPIIEEHYEILNMHPNKGAQDLELRYNSNGVEWRDDLFELWVINCKIYSIDSIKEMNSYIRYPSDWATPSRNIPKLDTETMAMLK